MNAMNANKPRESILSLFDPLSTPPETPTREVHTPDSSSDKENDAPSVQPGQLTTFFNRIYTHPKMVRMPPGKLIELDEAGGTTAERDIPTADAFADLENEENRAQEGPQRALNQDSGPITVAHNHRRPLADIKLAKIPPTDVRVPPTISEEESAECDSAEHESTWSEGQTVVESSHQSAAPSGTPLADVINSINLGSLSIHAEPEPSKETSEANCPDITVVPPESEPTSPDPSMSTTNGTSPFLSPIAPPPVFSPPVRRQHASTSSNDPRRISVDLQSSFCMQLRSPEMSFDLLNDKISFLSQGQDSFWSGADEDDTMDLAKEEYKMKMIAEKYESIKEEDEIEPVPKEKLQSPGLRKTDTGVRGPKIASPVFNPLRNSTVEIADPPVHVPTADVKAAGYPTSKGPAPSARHFSNIGVNTPVPALPPVPSLRILKKSKVHDRNSSGSSSGTACSSISGPSVGERATSSTCTSRSASRAGSECSDRDKTEERTYAIQPKIVKPAIRGVQRPPVGATVAPIPARVGGPMRVSAGAVRSSPAASFTSGLTRPSSFAPVRPAGSVPERPSGGNALRTAKAATVSKVQRPLPASCPDPARAASVDVVKKSTSGLRPPSRMTASGSASASTGIPRPASRLPMLSRTTGIKTSTTQRK